MIRKSVLDNGIRVITERVAGAHSVTVGFWVENGSRHEQEPENGISHFIEHMLFKGTERRSALAIAKEVDSVGGVLNAFTSREYSCYYAKVLARKLPLAVDLLSDIVLNSIFDLDEIENVGWSSGDSHAGDTPATWCMTSSARRSGRASSGALDHRYGRTVGT
jgi:predicted Zn-dependent peptidase